MGKSRSQSAGAINFGTIIRLLKALHTTAKPFVQSRAGKTVLKTVAKQAIKSDKLPKIVKKTGQVLLNTDEAANRPSRKRKIVSTKKKRQAGGGNRSKPKKNCYSARKHSKKPKLRDLFSE